MLSKSIQRMNQSGALLEYTRRSFAASEKQIKQRRKSVISIAKITKAMKMVAAAKMKGEL